MAEFEQDNHQQQIATILDETKASYVTHNRKLKELSNLRSSSPQSFNSSFNNAIFPVFSFQRRTSSAERIIRFISIFACLGESRKSSIDDDDDDFLESFLRFLLSALTSANKTARFRSCQIISEIIMRLPDDAEVNTELWDGVIESIVVRVGDKIPIVRTYAIRALSRFVNDSENSDVLDLFIQTLDSKQIAGNKKDHSVIITPLECNFFSDHWVYA